MSFILVALIILVIFNMGLATVMGLTAKIIAGVFKVIGRILRITK